MPEVEGATLDELPQRLDQRWQVGVVSMLDAVMQGIEEVDRLCGRAVVLLDRAASPAAKAAVLDLLAVLDDDRKAALYFALGAAGRKPCERHLGFSRMAQALVAVGEVEAALHDWNELRRLLGEDLPGLARTGESTELLRRVPERFRAALRPAVVA